MRVVLGSESPRRREILEFFGLPFVVAPSNFDEASIPFKGDLSHYVQTIAEKKGEALLSKYPTDIIVTADTIVALDGEVLLKPKDDQDSFGMLKKLAGRGHDVITGLAVRKGEKLFSGTEMTRVIFNRVTEREIRAYIKGAHGRDKAGSYGAQEVGSLLVKRIEGCFYNVLGLPVNLLRENLSHVGIDLWDVFSS